MIAAIFVSLVLGLQAQFAYANTDRCAEILSGSVQLEFLNSSIRDLSKLRINLDLARARGSNSIALTALAADYRKKQKALVEYLERQKIMTRDQLLERVKQEIARLQHDLRGDELKPRENEIRNEHENEILRHDIDGTRAVFHRLEPGSFNMIQVNRHGTPQAYIPVTISRPFYMMATPVTQIIWKKVVELVKARPKDYLPYRASPLRGDRFPVHSIPYAYVQIWIEELNELSRSGDPSLNAIIPDHQQGDVYRLPTEAEWEFVVRGRGQLNDKYFFGNDESQLDKYAWYNENSENKTHPVAEKAPLVIGNCEFFDILGNVSEMIGQRYEVDMVGGTDPIGSGHKPTQIIARSGCFYNSSDRSYSSERLAISASGQDTGIGFRLVRSAR